MRGRLLGGAGWLPLFEGEGIGSGAAGADNPSAKPVTPASPAPDTTANLRAELAAERVAKRELQRQVEEHQAAVAAAKAEVETKTRAAVEPLTAKLAKREARLVDAEMRAQAASLGLSDPDLLGHSFFDKTKVQVDDDGNVTGVKELFDEVKGKKPEWFKGGGQGASGGTTPAPKDTGSAAAAAAGGGQSAPTDVRKLDKAGYDAAKVAFLRSLKK